MKIPQILTLIRIYDIQPKKTMTYYYIFCTCGENAGKIQVKQKAK